MAKLPPTAYLRLVDVWLIRLFNARNLNSKNDLYFSTQLVPFIEVVLTTLCELYNNDGAVNHHGFSRYIEMLNSMNIPVILHLLIVQYGIFLSWSLTISYIFMQKLFVLVVHMTVDKFLGFWYSGYQP